MRTLALPFVSAVRQLPSEQVRFDVAYAAYARSQRAWVAALLDRHLLERVVLRDGVSDPREIARRWARSVCPHSMTPSLLRDAELAARDFLHRFEQLASARVKT